MNLPAFLLRVVFSYTLCIYSFYKSKWYERRVTGSVFILSDQAVFPNSFVRKNFFTPYVFIIIKNIHL